MQTRRHQIYSFDEFTLDLTRGSLLRETEEIKLRPKSFEVLKFLIENSGRLITKDEIIETVWQGMAVTDDSLVQCLKDIRLALNDKSQTFIKTVAVSPDGKYIAFAIKDSGRQSLWVRQVAAVNNLQIVAPATVEYNALTFSPDGNFIYYVEGDALYQTATFGGSTRKLSEGVSTKVTFSHDGKLLFISAGPINQNVVMFNLSR